MGKRLNILLVGVAAAALALAYAFVREARAEAAARAFCTGLMQGMPLAEVERRLAVDTAHDRVIDAPDGKLVIFTGLPPFSRYICHVEAAAGRVTAAHLGYLD